MQSIDRQRAIVNVPACSRLLQKHLWHYSCSSGIVRPLVKSLLRVCTGLNASRARQINPLNPPGVGWVPLPQTNMAAVVVRGRSCVVGRARSCTVGCARSCVRGRSCVVVHGHARSVVRGRAWLCVVVPFCPLRGQHCRGTNERTNEQHLITH